MVVMLHIHQERKITCYLKKCKLDLNKNRLDSPSGTKNEKMRYYSEMFQLCFPNLA